MSHYTVFWFVKDLNFNIDVYSYVVRLSISFRDIISQTQPKFFFFFIVLYQLGWDSIASEKYVN